MVELLRKATLNTRWMWFLAAVFIIANIGFGVTTGWLSSEQKRKDLADRYQKIALARTGALSHAVWIYEFGQTQSLLDEITADSNILTAKLYVDKQTLASPLTKEAPSTFETIIVPLVYKGPISHEHLGKFSITYSTQEASDIFQRQILESLIISFLLILIVFIGQRAFTARFHSAAEA